MLTALLFALSGAIALSAQGSAAMPRQVACPLAVRGHQTTCCGPPMAGAEPCCPTPTASPQATCCPTPTSGTQTCCPSNAECASLITIDAKPDPSTAGHQVTISGRVSSETAGASVALWQETPGGTFKQIALTSTNDVGQYQFVRSVETNLKWYATSGSLRSATIDQTVQAVVTLTSALRVTVSPSHVGQRVWLERREGSTWKVVARRRLGRSSSTFFRVTFVGAGRAELRAAFPGDDRNTRSYSKRIDFAY